MAHFVMSLMLVYLLLIFGRVNIIIDPMISLISKNSRNETDDEKQRTGQDDGWNEWMQKDEEVFMSTSYVRTSYNNNVT